MPLSASSSSSPAAFFRPSPSLPCAAGARIDAKFPVVVTSYEILLADIKAMAKYHWKYIVVDEVRGQAVQCGTAVCSPI